MTHSLGLIELPLTALEWDSTSDRKELKKRGIELEHYLRDLRESMIKEGIKKPPVVEWHLKTTPSSGTKFRVKEGNHRCEVAHGLGLKKITCRFEVIDYSNEWIVTGLKHLLNGRDV